MVVDAYNPGTQEAKAGLFKVSDQPKIHSEFQLIFGYEISKKIKQKTLQVLGVSGNGHKTLMSLKKRVYTAFKGLK